MNSDWQSWAALIVVGATVLIFAIRAARKGQPGSCGGGCGCEMKNQRLKDKT